MSTTHAVAGGAMLFWFMLGLICIVTTFGAGTAINMVFRKIWVSLILALALSIWLLVGSHGSLSTPLWILVGIGWVGTILSTWAVFSLKKRGYALFR